MKTYTGTCRVKNNSAYIYKSGTFKITGIYHDYKNGSGDGVYADGTREYNICLKDTEFERTHGYTSTVLHDSHLEDIELFECIELPLDEEETLQLISYAQDFSIMVSDAEILKYFLEESKKPSILPTPDLSTLYSDEEWGQLKNGKL